MTTDAKPDIDRSDRARRTPQTPPGGVRSADRSRRRDPASGARRSSRRERTGPQPGRRLGGVRRHRRHRAGLPGVGVRQHTVAEERVRLGADLDDGEHRMAVRRDVVGVRAVRALVGRQPVWRHPARPRRRGTRVQDDLVDRDDVQRRHGHRTDVLRCRRAAVAPGHASRRAPVEAGNPEAMQTAMATTLFHWTLHPWAIYAVVRPGHRLRRVPQGSPAVDQRRLRPPDR